MSAFSERPTKRRMHLLDQQRIVELLDAYGYWALFLTILLECCGLPLPGETMLIGAAIYAGSTGAMPIAAIVGVAAAGAILGDWLGFWIGRRYGSDYLLRRGRWLGLTPEKLALGHYMFLRWGGWVVFFGRFVTLLRVFAAVLAGANRMEPKTFLIFNTAGGVLWAAAFGFGAHALTENFHRLEGPFGALAFFALVAGLLFLWVYYKRNEARLMREALAAQERAR
jgi:membrane protein DedA with SNARE-associated domain